MVNNLMLAYICNDLENAKNYIINGDKCFYLDEYIGVINEIVNDDGLQIYFKPVKPIQSININFTIKNENH